MLRARDGSCVKVNKAAAEGLQALEEVEKLRGDGRSRRPYELPKLGTGAKWLADGELLDPESPAEMFEAVSERGLFRRAGSWMRRRE